MDESKPLSRPKKLLRGDRVGVVAPAGWVKEAELERGLRVLRRMGLEPVKGRSVTSRLRYLAGSDAERAADLMAMFSDPSINAIICARGGYGSNRVIEHLDADVIADNPKIFVGSSDITTLLMYLTQTCSMVAFHGPMAAGSFGRRPMPRSRAQFSALLSGNAGALQLAAPRAKVIRPGTARGRLAGGCLTLLCRSLKTPWEIDTRGAILLIEDVAEPPYRIDGMLCQLRQAGKFDQVRGVVFGEMVDCRPPPKEKWTLPEVIADLFHDAPFPVLYGCPIGHGNEIWTLPLGREAEIDTARRSLTPADCGVE